jgi:hypothetical protein
MYSYSMDTDELRVQREGYARAIISKEFLQALKTGPNNRIAFTYFEWSASSDQRIIVPWRDRRPGSHEKIRCRLRCLEPVAIAKCQLICCASKLMLEAVICVI